MITYNEGLDDYMNVKTESSLDFYKVKRKVSLGRSGYSDVRSGYLIAGEFLVGYSYFQRDKVST